MEILYRLREFSGQAKELYDQEPEGIREGLWAENKYWYGECLNPIYSVDSINSESILGKHPFYDPLYEIHKEISLSLGDEDGDLCLSYLHDILAMGDDFFYTQLYVPRRIVFDFIDKNIPSSIRPSPLMKLISQWFGEQGDVRYKIKLIKPAFGLPIIDERGLGDWLDFLRLHGRPRSSPISHTEAITYVVPLQRGYDSISPGRLDLEDFPHQSVVAYSATSSMIFTDKSEVSTDLPPWLNRLIASIT
jgi:hypothetical protein